MFSGQLLAPGSTHSTARQRPRQADASITFSTNGFRDEFTLFGIMARLAGSDGEPFFGDQTDTDFLSEQLGFTAQETR